MFRAFAGMTLCAALMLTSPAAVFSQTRPATSPSTFDQALEQASFAVQYNDPSSIQHGIDLLKNVINAFKHDPGVYKAKLGIVDILRGETNDAAIAQAEEILQSMLGEAHPDSSAGREISMKYIDFQVGDAEAFPFHDLKNSERLIDEEERWAVDHHDRLQTVKTWEQKGRLLKVKGEPLKAVSFLLAKLREIEGWEQDGFLRDLYATDLAQYRSFMNRMHEFFGAMGGAIIQSGDSNVDLIVAQAGLVGEYPQIRSALTALHALQFPESPPGNEAADESSMRPMSRTTPKQTPGKTSHIRHVATSRP
jgi:hypothetical protein